MDKTYKPLFNHYWAEKAPSNMVASDMPIDGAPTPGGCSFEYGWSEETMRSYDTGGIAPGGKFFNAKDQVLSKSIQQLNTGSPIGWSQDFANTLHDTTGAGYPIYSVVAHNGYLWVCTQGNNTNEPSVDLNSNWVRFGDWIRQIVAESHGNKSYEVPIGAVQWFAGKFIPDGYLICDGREFDINHFADLFKVLGGVAGESNFTPDLMGRSAQGTNVTDDVGQQGGQSNVNVNLPDIDIGRTGETRLTKEQMPSHTHSLNNSPVQDRSGSGWYIEGGDTHKHEGGGNKHYQPTLEARCPRTGAFPDYGDGYDGDRPSLSSGVTPFSWEGGQDGNESAGHSHSIPDITGRQVTVKTQSPYTKLIPIIRAF